jgi:hypothetical protein
MQSPAQETPSCPLLVTNSDVDWARVFLEGGDDDLTSSEVLAGCQALVSSLLQQVGRFIACDEHGLPQGWPATCRRLGTLTPKTAWRLRPACPS